MAKRLFVGNLSFQATSDQVREHFAIYGAVENVNVVTDAYSGRSRGFAFVEMASEDAAQKAREALNGKPFQDRNLTVDWARPMERNGGAGNGARREYSPRNSYSR
jgi:RNA recognition motif-containing protein